MKILISSSNRKIFPVIITLSALVSGFLSIIMSILGQTTNQSDFYNYASYFILLALILDGLDGNIARLINGQSEFGAELDTFVDYTAFGVAPAVLLFSTSLVQFSFFYRIIVPVVIIIFGATRLSRFRVKDHKRGLDGYTGLPVTINATFISLGTLYFQNIQSLELNIVYEIIFLAMIVLLCILQVTNIFYPPPTKKWILFLCGLFLLSTLAILNFFSVIYIKGWILYLILIGLIYVFVVPVLAHRMRKH